MSSDHHRHSTNQIVAYLVSGGAFFWTGYLWFYLADQQFGWSLLSAKISADFIGLSINFLLQHYWVFKTHRSTEHVGRITTRYLIVTLVGFGLDYFLVAGLKQAGISPYIGQFIAAGLFGSVNYFIYKFWVFRQR